MNKMFRWEQIQFRLNELADNVDKTTCNSEFNQCVNSISGCSIHVELINVLGCRHELGISFSFWRGVHADPMCTFSKEEDDKYVSLAHDLVLRLNRNMTKWLKKLQLADLLVYPELSDCFCVFHDVDDIAVESMCGFHILVDLV